MSLFIENQVRPYKLIQDRFHWAAMRIAVKLICEIIRKQLSMYALWHTEHGNNVCSRRLTATVL